MTILFFVVAAIGFLPLVKVLIKRHAYRRVIQKGVQVSARIEKIVPGMSNRYGVVNEKVQYQFTAKDGKAYSGKMISLPGKLRRSDLMEVYYLPDDPAKNVVKHSGNNIGGLLFVIAIAVFVAFAMWQLYRMINKQ